jgi:hypothetical protein
MARLEKSTQRQVSDLMYVCLQLPSSAYCLAISATASPIFFLTLVMVSPCRHCNSLDRMASFCAGCRVRNSSFGSLLFSNFRVFVEIRRNKTAAKDLVCLQELLALTEHGSHGFF